MAAAPAAQSIKGGFQTRFDELNREYNQLQDTIKAFNSLHTSLEGQSSSMRDDDYNAGVNQYNTGAQETRENIDANRAALGQLLADINAAVDEHARIIGDMAGAAVAAVASIERLLQQAEHIQRSNPAIAAAAAAAISAITTAQSAVANEVAKLQDSTKITTEQGKKALEIINAQKEIAEAANRELEAAAAAAAAAEVQRKLEAEAAAAAAENRRKEEQKLDELETEITRLENVDPDLNATGQIDLTKSSPQAIINDGLKENLHNRIRDGITTFSSKLNSLGSKLREINTDNSDIRTRLSGLKERHNTLNDKLEYYKQQQQQLQPSPPTEQATTTRPFNRFRPSFTALNQWNRRGQNDEAAAAEQQEPEAASSSEKIEKKPTGRRYSIFVPEPKGVTPTKSRTQAASTTSETTADAIEPAENVLDVVVYGDEEQSGSTGAAATRGGGARIQHGGNGRVVKIIRVKTVTPEIEELFLGFEPPNIYLTDNFLTEMEKSKGREIIDNPETIQEEYKKYGRELIENTDDHPFFESLGPKVVHKSTISKMVTKLLDDTNVRLLSNIKHISGKNINQPKTYLELYLELWRFMKHDNCIGVLVPIFEKKTINVDLSKTGRSTSRTLYDILINTKIEHGVTQDHKKQRLKDLTWTDKQNNRVLDKLFIDELSASCLDGKSEFLTKQVKDKGADKYSFMLNWIILIAFHLYHIATDQTKQPLLEACGELIEHMYYTFIWWMKHADATALHVAFKPGEETYEVKVKKLINSGITGDQTLRILVNNIKRFLCVNDKKTYNDVEPDIRPTSSGHPSKMNPRTVSPNISDRVDMFDNFAAPRSASSQLPALRPTTSSTSPSKERPASPLINRLAGQQQYTRTLSASSASGQLRPSSPRPTNQPTALQQKMPAEQRYNTTGRTQLQPLLQGEQTPERAFTVRPVGQQVTSNNAGHLKIEDIDNTITQPQPNDRQAMTEDEMQRVAEDSRTILKEKEHQTLSIYDEPQMRQKKLNALKREQRRIEEQHSHLNRGGYSQGSKPRTRKHNSAKPQTTTKRKRSTHPVNQRRKYTRRARQDRVSGSAKRTKRVKNNLG